MACPGISYTAELEIEDAATPTPRHAGCVTSTRDSIPGPHRLPPSKATSDGERSAEPRACSRGAWPCTSSGTPWPELVLVVARELELRDHFVVPKKIGCITHGCLVERNGGKRCERGHCRPADNVVVELYDLPRIRELAQMVALSPNMPAPTTQPELFLATVHSLVLNVVAAAHRDGRWEERDAVLDQSVVFLNRCVVWSSENTPSQRIDEIIEHARRSGLTETDRAEFDVSVAALDDRTPEVVN